MRALPSSVRSPHPLAFVSSGPLAFVSSGPLAFAFSGPLAFVFSGPLASIVRALLLILLGNWDLCAVPAVLTQSAPLFSASAIQCITVVMALSVTSARLVKHVHSWKENSWQSTAIFTSKFDSKIGTVVNNGQDQVDISSLWYSCAGRHLFIHPVCQLLLRVPHCTLSIFVESCANSTAWCSEIGSLTSLEQHCSQQVQRR